MEPAIPGAEEEIVAGEDEPRGEMDEVAFFAQRVAVFLTSSDERRYGQWEHTSWWDFVPGRATLPGCNHRPC